MIQLINVIVGGYNRTDRKEFQTLSTRKSKENDSLVLPPVAAHQRLLVVQTSGRPAEGRQGVRAGDRGAQELPVLQLRLCRERVQELFEIDLLRRRRGQ